MSRRLRKKQNSDGVIIVHARSAGRRQKQHSANSLDSFWEGIDEYAVIQTSKPQMRRAATLATNKQRSTGDVCDKFHFKELDGSEPPKPRRVKQNSTDTAKTEGTNTIFEVPVPEISIPEGHDEDNRSNVDQDDNDDNINSLGPNQSTTATGSRRGLFKKFGGIFGKNKRRAQVQA